ncbi:MAG: sigma 54-interacting transcriptional regulator, partial [Planctomycetota bacterium]|nr:sigma 54-interacting transcriptional regulator [Planctomycetota bacterium]
MPLFTPAQRQFAEALSRLAYCNPFLPERFEHERAALGEAYEIEEKIAWSRQSDWGEDRSNVRRLAVESEALSERIRAALLAGNSATKKELELYEDLALYVVYYRFVTPFIKEVNVSGNLKTWLTECVAVWPQFLKDFKHFFHIAGTTLPNHYDAGHIFACLFQVCRAFWNIFDNIVGDSLPAAQLRAEIWQSIFTHDMRRYRRSLFNRMSDVTTLITGPSGTGKELVARAIGLSQYVPFDIKSQRFVGEPANMFFTLNLSALSSTLIESELFGHSKGAFTGAVANRAGWLEMAPACGTVFLDEIGELDTAIQVKLLRVVQS